jgi:hypothetical protein
MPGKLSSGPLRRGARRAAASPRLARWLLGIEVPPIGPGRRYFDLTTPILVHVVAPDLDAESRVLDMGTGAFAAIGLSLWRRTACTVVASDVDADLVEQARGNVKRNAAPIEVVHASLFDVLDHVEGSFDCVTFNAPYVPTGFVGADGGDLSYAGQSDGGAEGTDVIDAFLAGFARQWRVARAYLGVNSMMVPRATVEACVAGRSELQLRDIRRRAPFPIDVFVIESPQNEGLVAGDAV